MDLRDASRSLWSALQTLGAVDSLPSMLAGLSAEIVRRTEPLLARPMNRCDKILRIFRVSRGGVRIRDVAESLGTTERTIHREASAAVGLPPKVLCRLHRLQHFRSEVRAAPQRTLAAHALAAGFADQAHLHRECRRLAGAAPTELLR
jgi:methylphosphotriester-DNA--protein-cysteine methyltransferase